MLAAVLAAIAFGMSSDGDTAPFQGPYRIERGKPRVGRVTLTQGFAMPGVSIGEWWVVVADPPSHEGQSANGAEIQVVGAPNAEVGRLREEGARRQSVLSAHWFSDHPALAEAKVVTSYDLTLIPRRLVEGEPDAAVPPLPPGERTASLRSAGLIDHASNEFRRWMKEKGLIRGKDERDLNFAFKTLETIARTHSYKWIANANPKPSVVCKRGWGECGALSYLFVAALRANKIPARALAGRWAKSSAPGREVDSGTFHVRAEFWAEGVGWVPVEVSNAVSGRGLGLSRWFGYDPGDMLTFHYDSVVVQDRQTLLQQATLTISNAVGFGRLKQTESLKVEFAPLECGCRTVAFGQDD